MFSQMVRVLDIISDYMRKRGYQHQRLDGSTPAHARHQAMEHFNAPGEAVPVLCRSLSRSVLDAGVGAPPGN